MGTDEEKKTFAFRAIGEIRTPFSRNRGAPIQGASSGAEGRVVLLGRYAAGLEDVDGFGYVHLLYVFDRSGPFSLSVRPFLDSTERGVFSTRAPSRPNPLGLTVVEVLERSGCELRVRGVDMLDRTPLLDIKPYVPRFDDRAGAHIGWLADRVQAMPGTTDDGRFARS